MTEDNTKMQTKTIVITGGNAGLGYWAAEQLASQGHRIILASRNAEKSAKAIASIIERIPGAKVEFQELDLADLHSVERAAVELQKLPQIDVLLLNAGVVGSRRYRTTAQGYELQIGTNHLGHFALSAALLTKLEAQAEAKILHLGSISHRWARLPQDSLFPKRYHNFVNYAVSKLSVMTFGFALARLLEERKSPVKSIVVHPGFSWDHFDKDVPEFLQKKPLPWYLALILRPIAQGKQQGAQVLSFVADSTVPKSGEYWGPDGFFQLKGKAALRIAKPWSRNEKSAQHLWNFSEALGFVTID
ncbi:MAG: SDR family NAD(P)-dependent oxidoreductase [Microbacteriaceae bacterium]